MHPTIVSAAAGPETETTAASTENMLLAASVGPYNLVLYPSRPRRALVRRPAFRTYLANTVGQKPIRGRRSPPPIPTLTQLSAC